MRRVAIDNCVITNSNRGIAFMVFDGGTVSDVVLSNLTIECKRRDWFWWGEGDPLYFAVRQRSDLDARLRSADEPPAGSIQNVLIRGVIARGSGTSSIEGHASSPLEHITIDGLTLHMSADPSAPFETAEHALAIKWAKDLELRNVEVVWDAPASPRWKSALAVEDAQGLRLEGFAARQAQSDASAPAIVLADVDGAVLRGCRARRGTAEFLHVAGSGCRDIQLIANDLREAKIPFAADSDALGDSTIRSSGDLVRER